jgi:hypothetical protein
MANTYVKIASTTVGLLGAATIDFTSIPSTYTDILIKASLRTAFATPDDYILIKPNNSTSSLTFRAVRGDGSSASSTTLERPAANGNTSTASTFGNLDIYFPNYAGSTNKSFSIDTVTENNATLALATLNAHLWSDTSAINRVVIAAGSGSNFLQYSTATLYGISKS